jgi:hypothetical protein
MRFLYLFLVLYFSALSANELTCSINGTKLYYLPGFFTSLNNQFDVADALRLNIKSNKDFVIDKKKQEFELIPIASQGKIQDELNYIKLKGDSKFTDSAYEAVEYFEVGRNIFGFLSSSKEVGKIVAESFKTQNITRIGGQVKKGTTTISKVVKESRVKDDLNFFSTIGSIVTGISKDKTLKEILFSQDGEYNSTTRLFKLLPLANILSRDPFAIKNGINLLSLFILEKDYKLAVENSRDALISGEITTGKNIKKIKDKILENLKANYQDINLNKKIIISAHAEGNLLLKKAVEEIKNSGTDEEKILISKYLAILSTSPQTEKYHKKYLFMKNNDDYLASGASNFTITKSIASINDISEYVSTYVYDYKNSDFLMDYFSENKMAIYNGDTEGKAMFAHYTSMLVDSALSLEDNCMPVLSSIYLQENEQILSTYNSILRAIPGRYLDLKIVSIFNKKEIPYYWYVKNSKGSIVSSSNTASSNVIFEIAEADTYSITISSSDSSFASEDKKTLNINVSTELTPAISIQLDPAPNAITSNDVRTPEAYNYSPYIPEVNLKVSDLNDIDTNKTTSFHVKFSTTYDIISSVIETNTDVNEYDIEEGVTQTLPIPRKGRSLIEITATNKYGLTTKYTTEYKIGGVKPVIKGIQFWCYGGYWDSFTKEEQAKMDPNAEAWNTGASYGLSLLYDLPYSNPINGAVADFDYGCPSGICTLNDGGQSTTFDTNLYKGCVRGEPTSSNNVWKL